jgi:hypothetical protein
MQTMHPAPGALTALAGLGNIAVIIVGLILLVILLITRGSVRRDGSRPAV